MILLEETAKAGRKSSMRELAKSPDTGRRCKVPLHNSAGLGTYEVTTALPQHHDEVPILVTPREHAGRLDRTSVHLDRASVLAMLLYCVFLAGFFYALSYTPVPRTSPSTAMIDVPPELTRDETIGYR
jgi:hypothetical protein